MRDVLIVAGVLIMMVLGGVTAVYGRDYVWLLGPMFAIVAGLLGIERLLKKK